MTPALHGNGNDLEPQVRAIREVVAREGGYTVSCEELRVLCPDDLSVPEQFARIASIAQHEGWSFAFLPDGTVHFGTYLKSAPPASQA